jgi:hypothetical protein
MGALFGTLLYSFQTSGSGRLLDNTADSPLSHLTEGLFVSIQTTSFGSDTVYSVALPFVVMLLGF